jgi:hypothetical protein
VTSNQARAILLAHALCDGSADPLTLAEADWHLLLLAAGENRACSCERTVARRVLHAAQTAAGYFSPVDAPVGPHRPEHPAVAA